MLLPKLVISSFRRHKVRVALTVAAVAMSVSLVVSVTTGYASIREAAFRYLNQYIGSIDAQITPTDDSAWIPQSLAQTVRADEDVANVLVRLETQAQIQAEEAFPLGRLAQVTGLQRPVDREVEKLPVLAGEWFTGEAGNVAVVDQVAADLLGLRIDEETFDIGKSINLPALGRELELTVVAVVRKPTFLAQQNPSIYLPLATLQSFLDPENPRQVNRIMITFEPGSDADAVAARFEQTLDPSLRFRLASDTRQQMSRNMEGLEILSYLGGSVAMLAATFIVFSSLSMGVTERSRTLAMLRAVGAVRSQLARLVVIEGLILAGIGVAIGVPLGLLWVEILALRFETFFSAGLVVGWGGLWFGAIGTLLAALLASLLPAVMATRTDPLESMSPLAQVSGSSFPWKAAIAGLLLASIDSLLLLGPLDWLSTRMGLSPDLMREIKFYGHFAIGLAGIMVGFFLLSPAFVWLIERVLGPVVAAMHGVRYALLRQQLSSGLWRAAGTCAALMVGLAVLVVMQTQGNTLLGGWQLPTRFPDIFIVSPLQPLTPQQAERLETVPGIREGEVMPLAVAAPGLPPGFLAITGVAMIPDATMFLGIDPDRAFELMELDFRTPDGASAAPDLRDRLEEQAKQMLKKGRHIIITEEFRQLKGLGVGDTIQLRTNRSGEVEYTVAGVVWSPGLDVIVGMYDLDRTFDQRTAASVFGTLEDARRDFGVHGYEIFVANVEIGVGREEVLDEVKAAVGKWGMLAYDIRHIKFAIEEGFRQILLLMSTVALAAMAVAALGVTNTVMASVRSRRWQFGVLRSIGVTRGQLLRIVLAEAMLLGLIGCALGLAAGLLMSVNARAMSAGIMGYNPPLNVPWDMVGYGVIVIMTIAIVASIWPAVSAARAQPLGLLQAGRASA